MTKMVMAVVPRDPARRVLEELVAAGHTATFSECRGGVMRQAQLQFFIAVKEEDLAKVLDIIRENCRTEVQVGSSVSKDGLSLGPIPVTADLGGAVVFIWDLDHFETY